MNRIAAGLLALALAFFAATASAQTPIRGFPPGTFQSRAAIDASGGGAAYSGPGDVVASATMWWGLRAYSLAKAGTKIANVCNAGDANCADINSLANGDFDVSTAQGAPLNCGTTGGTCTIKTLYDQTAGNACTAAVCDLTQSLSTGRPILTFNAVGTKTCMTYSGGQQLAEINSATSVAMPNTISSVANSTNTGAQQGLLTFVGGGSFQLGYRNSANNQVFVFAGSVLTATASDGSFHALQAAVTSGGGADMNVDGSANAGFAGTDPQVGGVALGSAGGGTQVMTGVLCESGTWPIAFSSGQSSSMSSNQHSYWGF